MCAVYSSPLATRFTATTATAQEPRCMRTLAPPAPPAFNASSGTENAARILTDVLAPANLVTALLLLIGWHSTDSRT
ncbi:hypothetical protein [Kitasatospora sp. DSM 101779]|uniref:hypothetical protein n=1 Tax=Kitasatospora sp. DSM 101779 TaxID=2853165 RepID=UPI0021D7DD54|nr:hypothetical protein [Kitasatospora sp. DSM 101779]